MNEQPTRQAFLTTVGDILTERDNAQTGLVLRRIAALWSAHLDFDLTPTDVALMMALLKIGRTTGPGLSHRDNYIDMAGYVTLAAETQDRL